MNKRIIYYAAAGVTTISLWFFLLYVPARKEEKDTLAMIESANRQLNDFSHTMEELPAFLKQLDDLEAFKKELNSSLYAKEDILKLFTRISEDVSGYDLKFIEISPTVEELLKLNRVNQSIEQPQFLNFALHLEGKYTDFGKYITYLESTTYFRNITSCYIRGRKDIERTITMSVSFRAIIGSLENSA